jgi:hypothetical protein
MCQCANVCTLTLLPPVVVVPWAQIRIEKPPPQEFELRTIIWRCKDVKPADMVRTTGTARTRWGSAVVDDENDDDDGVMVIRRSRR